jgi:hypothetical protein
MDIQALLAAQHHTNELLEELNIMLRESLARMIELQGG